VSCGRSLFHTSAVSAFPWMSTAVISPPSTPVARLEAAQ
jgi:hypothetical protein